MTDLLWGEIRSLLHADKIERPRAREIALALAEGLTDERAELLLMLVDGLTHKRGDVIVDGEWVELPEDIEDMTLAELTAAHDYIEPPMLRLLKQSNTLLDKIDALHHEAWIARERAEYEAEAEADEVTVRTFGSPRPDGAIGIVVDTSRLNAAHYFNWTLPSPAFSNDEIINLAWGVSHDDT